jgi:hypothetical protein
MIRLPLILALCALAVPACSAAPKNSSAQSLLKGKWQGMGEGRMAIEITPISKTAGTALFFFDGHRYERVNYRIIGKDKLQLPAQKVTYTFSVEKNTLRLSLGKNRSKWYRRVNGIPPKVRTGS